MPAAQHRRARAHHVARTRCSSSDASWAAISSGSGRSPPCAVSPARESEPREQRAGPAADGRGVLRHAQVHLGRVERAGDLLGGPLQPQLVTGAPALGLEQAGPLERDRREVGERLDGRHLLLPERTAPVDRGHHQRARAGCRTRPAPGRRSATPRWRVVHTRCARLFAELGRHRVGQLGGRLPGVDARQEERAACRTSRGHAGRERRAQLVVGEPADRVAAAAPRRSRTRRRTRGARRARAERAARACALATARGRRTGGPGEAGLAGSSRGPLPCFQDMCARAVSPPVPRSGGACPG